MSFCPSASIDGGFRPEYFELLAEAEAGSFWFRARNRLICWAVAPYLSGNASYCEIGCGTGYVLSGLARAFPAARLSASEIYAEALSFAASRVPSASFYQMDARRIPFAGEFDVIGSFDVLEHIEDDERVMAQMHRALVPKGRIIVTVPQHPFMWSQQDEHACHVRRYTAREIRSKLESAGFTVDLMTSFVSLLFPLMFLTRRRSHAADYDATSDLRLSSFVDSALDGVMTVERALIRAGLRFPFGGSLLVVAQRKD